MTPPPDDDLMDIDGNSPDANNLDNVPRIVDRAMSKGEAWYLVDKQWYDQFLRYLANRDVHQNPGPINNCNLFDPLMDGALTELKLREGLYDELNYKLVPEEAWDILSTCFGTIDERQAIKRFVIAEGINNTNCTVEVYLTQVAISLYGNHTYVAYTSYSRATLMSELEMHMKRVLNIDPDQETRIHHLDTTLSTDDGKTIAEACISSGQSVIMEVRNKNGNWPSARAQRAVPPEGHVPGICGLQNLGNTCFMNSAVQCLSNTPPLTEFITSLRYESEINYENTLGSGGRIAKEYGNMIKMMWSGQYDNIAPREFKYVIGKLSSQFCGYAQHDAQELMAFLLDGLHEDLNRVTERQYVEAEVHVDERPDDVVAEESWRNYKRLNDSIVVDTFHGLLKSTLVCPVCQLVSRTFDPFCYLSLPLPLKRERDIDVVFVPASNLLNDPQDNTDTIRLVSTSFAFHKMSVPKITKASDIVAAIVEIINMERILDHGIDETKLIVTEVYDHRFHRVYESYTTIDDNAKELVVYEMPGERILPVYLREVYPDGVKKPFGRPFFVAADNVTYDNIYQPINNYLSHFYKIIGDDDSTDSDQEVSAGKVEPFALMITNLLGTIEIEKLERNKPFHLDGASCISLDLPIDTKLKRYDLNRENPLWINASKTKKQEVTYHLYDIIRSFMTTEKLGE